MVYLDARTDTCLEEGSGFNVFAVTKDGTVRVSALSAATGGSPECCVLWAREQRGVQEVQEVC